MQRFFDIASADQPIDVPLTEAQILRLGEMCGVTTRTRVLDLACGKGEVLVQWAKAFDLQGTGVDESETNIDRAQHRANELEVWSQLHFVVADVLQYPQAFHQYNIVSLLGATGTGISLTELVNVMREALKDEAGGLLLVGEDFWQKEPDSEVLAALDVERDWIPTLASLARGFTAAGVELRDMLIAAPEDRDRFNGQQWRACLNWLDEHPDDDDALEIRAWLTRHRQSYLAYERDYLGWGVFVLSVPGIPAPPVEKPTDEDDGLHFDWQGKGEK
jgi:cyclopropane fatty-acyl-phospholipid synthase-like methyltransferase